MGLHISSSAATTAREKVKRLGPSAPDAHGPKGAEWPSLESRCTGIDISLNLGCIESGHCSGYCKNALAFLPPMLMGRRGQKGHHWKPAALAESHCCGIDCFESWLRRSRYCIGIDCFGISLHRQTLLLNLGCIGIGIDIALESGCIGPDTGISLHRHRHYF